MFIWTWAPLSSHHQQKKMITAPQHPERLFYHLPVPASPAFSTILYIRHRPSQYFTLLIYFDDDVYILSDLWIMKISKHSIHETLTIWWQYDMTISITMVSRLFKCFDREDPQSSTCPLLFTKILVCQCDRISPHN